MDIRYIHNFLRVVNTGSMSEAARQLDLSPSAIAQQMRVLEGEMGAALLVRQGRSVRATAAGERLFERGRQLLQEVEGLREWVASDTDGGELRLGTVNTALHGFLPAVMRAFVDRHADVRISVRAGLTPELYTALLQSELDVLLCLKPSFDLPKSVCWAELRQEPLVVLCRAADAHEDPLALLRTRPLVRYDRSLAGGRLAERYLRARGIAPLERMELNSVLAVAMMVDQGLGVGLVPDIGAVLGQGRDVRVLALPEQGDGGEGQGTADARKVGLLWLHTSARARWARSLLECARECLGAGPLN
ncbi:Cyn operon transcriptional activator [Delftia tsuruhatensis]|uniref:LysR family transcriptional regulator n=1 Tax=Delftia tsuruhatensis TaxID=180282 RepID=UPI001E75B937|nr:LysR family transcriptional regulator [Delftia tsuruhatensis]CAB5679754.1 Cyn operon transcriptional activator [Delftia tsuruhatensis]CAC9693265.1 Cyn operon transcriptional activator [Delftia tsuruhatensis]